MFTRKFWLDAIERMVRYSASSALSSIGTTALLQEVDWRIVGGTVGMGAVISLLLSLAGSQRGDTSSASLLQPGPPETP